MIDSLFGPILLVAALGALASLITALTNVLPSSMMVVKEEGPAKEAKGRNQVIIKIGRNSLEIEMGKAGTFVGGVLLVSSLITAVILDVFMVSGLP